MSKESFFKTPLGSQRGNGSQSLLKNAREHESWKKSFLVRSQILGLFVYTLTAHDKYSRRNRENFPLPIYMNLLKKLKTFSEIFIKFLKLSLIFEHFEKKDESHS